MKLLKKLIWIGCFGAMVSFHTMGQDNTAAVSSITHPSTWTLQQCIDWAKQQNITIQRNRVSERSADIDLSNAKNNRLPTVSASSSQQFSNRPFQEGYNSVVGSEVVYHSNKNSYTGSYGVTAAMTLYDGGVLNNNVKLAELNTRIAELNTRASELSIEEQITQLYVQILYSQETIKQDEELIELSQAQLDRAKALKQAGLLNKADVAQLEMQTAQDKYQKVADETTLDNYKLQLKQLLELDGDEALEIADPELENNVLAELPAKIDVYEHAVATRPEIQAKQLAMEKTYLDEKIAAAGHKPTISASAGISTSNSTGNGNMFTQLKEQWNNGIGVTLSIPIWDHHKTKNAVAKARLERETAYLDILDTQKTLWKSIETYWLNARSNQQRYVAAKENEDYCRESYDLTSEQFRLGLKNIIELTTAKTNLDSATQKTLQAKYMALLNLAMLRYYNGESIGL